MADTDETNSNGDYRPWTSWQPNPQDPSEKPWLYWGDKRRDDGPEMVAALSRFQVSSLGAVYKSE